jgi:LPXTG-motif cell wall-anchored protein
MKKFLSIIMVLAMVLSLSITAFAEENKGSITITNATFDETYGLYKIFNASISKDADGETEAVSYSIKADNQFFASLFGADGKTDNTYFVYNADTGSVTKKEGVNDADLIDYLTDLVEAGNYQPAVTPVVADSDEVKFENLPYGYYLITSTLGTTVTINSNTPDVSVIDKNQEPGAGFDKQIATSRDEDGKPTAWGDSNTANIADEVTYKISFEATNYDGENKIEYYQIHDEKGDAIWAEFNSFKVVVGGKELPRGYYLSQGGKNTDNWEFLNAESDHPDSWKYLTEDQKTRDNAQWYLVHLDTDKFRITIPWMEDHSITEIVSTDDKPNTYSINFPENADFNFTSPVTVEITYNAVVEANAAIGDTTHGNRFNKAYASWTSTHETLTTKPEEVVTYVYGIGLLKDDIATRENLAGAKFRVYKDAECTQPVFVIPTDIKGVYIVDSLYTVAESTSGLDQETARMLYEKHLEEYLKDEKDNAIEQNNLVVSQENGKLVILGLKEGTYYLKEVEAPAGYNALTQPVEFKAGEDIRSFTIFADKDGKVANIQQADGVHHEINYDLTHTVVHNSKGVVLPSTGGMGTFWLITIGTILAIGFAVFLITHKKMSVYTD